MNERPSDFELLRAFVRQGGQEALTATVRRRVDLVYATALRKVGDTGVAEEVVQNVFSAAFNNAAAAGDWLPSREFVGHDSTAVSQNYTHIPTDTLRQAANKLPNILD